MVLGVGRGLLLGFLRSRDLVFSNNGSFLNLWRRIFTGPQRLGHRPVRLNWRVYRLLIANLRNLMYLLLLHCFTVLLDHLGPFESGLNLLPSLTTIGLLVDHGSFAGRRLRLPLITTRAHTNVVDDAS